MKSTGVIRRIDELGRIVVPKEIRKNLRIKDGENLEIFIENDCIILRKYSPVLSLKDLAFELCESLYGVLKRGVLLCDLDYVVAAAGSVKKELISKRIGRDIEKLLGKREISYERVQQRIELVQNYEMMVSYVGAPIMANGDVIGYLLVFDNSPVEEVTKKMVMMSTQFVGRYLES